MSQKEKKPVSKSLSLEIVPPVTDPILSELRLNESDCTKLIDALKKGRQEKVVKKLRLLTKRLTGVTNHLKNQELKAISLAKSIENVEKSLTDKKLQIDGFQEFEQAATRFRDQVLGGSARSSASTMLSARITTAAKIPASDAAASSKDTGTTLEMKIEYEPRMKLTIPETISQVQQELPIAFRVPATLSSEKAERQPYDPTDDPDARTEAHLDSNELNLSPFKASTKSQGTKSSSERMNRKLFGTSKADEIAERAPYISADLASRTERNLAASTPVTNVDDKKSSSSKTKTKRVTLLKQDQDQISSDSTEKTPGKKGREKQKQKVKETDNILSDEIAVRAEYQPADTASRTENELDNADYGDVPESETPKRPESLAGMLDKWAKIDQVVQKLKGKGTNINQNEPLEEAIRAEYTSEDVKSRTEREISGGLDDDSTENTAVRESLARDILREVKTILRVEKKLQGLPSDDKLSELAPKSSEEDEKKVVPVSEGCEGRRKSKKPSQQVVTPRRARASAEDLADLPSGGTTISIDEERPRRMPSSYIPSRIVTPIAETSKGAIKRRRTSSRSTSSRCESSRTFWPTANFWRKRSCSSLLCLLIIFLTTVYVAYRSLDALADAYKVSVDDCQQARYLCERFQKCCFTTCGSTKWQIFRRKVFGSAVSTDKVVTTTKDDLELSENIQF